MGEAVREGEGRGGRGIYELLVLSDQFCCESQSALNISFYLFIYLFIHSFIHLVEGLEKGLLRGAQG